MPHFDDQDLQHAASLDIKAQIVDELEKVVASVESQLGLAHILEYASGASITKLLQGTQGLPVEKAALLDDWMRAEGKTTACGHAMVDLVKAQTRAAAADRKKTTDVLVASPMSAAGGEYEVDRALAMRLVDALRAQSLKVYFAGEEIKKPSSFDSYDLAYKANLRHILSARVFVLFLPHGRRTDGPPSSVWIELGMALARNIPVTIFAPTSADLPYIVRRAIEDGQRRVLDTHFFDDDPELPGRWIKKSGKGILLGGAEL